MTDPTPPTWCCMTRPTGEDEMSNETEWVLVPKDAIERAIETLENDGDEHGEGRNLRAMLDAAPQPPAEAQAVGYACNGPEGTFWTDDAALANKLIGAAFDRDEWTVTDTQNPTGAAPPPSAPVGVEAKDAEIEALRVRADAMAGEAIKHEARAERLAEALREVERLMPDQAGPAWIAKTIASAALRDHDQEGK